MSGYTLGDFAEDTKELRTALAAALSRAEQAERERIEPVVFRRGELFIAALDYFAQGRTEDEARANFVRGWRATVEANARRGITPEQMANTFAEPPHLTSPERLHEIAEMIGKNVAGCDCEDCVRIATNEAFDILTAQLTDKKEV